MTVSKRRLLPLFTLILLGMVAHQASAQTSILYVTDYGNNILHRFDGATGALLSPDPFISGANANKGEQTLQVGNNLYMATDENNIRRYDASTGALQATYGLPGAIGVTSAGGNNLYVSGYGGDLKKIDGLTGSVLGSINTGVQNWTVRQNGSTLLVSAGFNYGANPGVYAYDLNLNPIDLNGGGFNTGDNLLVPGGTATLGMPAGIAVMPNGDFFVANSAFSPVSTINRYNSSGSLITTISLTAIDPSLHGYDVAINPLDGFLYATAASTTNPGCILRFNTTTNAFDSIFVNNAGGVGINSPKALSFSTPAVAAPEPGTLVLFGIGLALVRKRRKR